MKSPVIFICISLIYRKDQHFLKIFFGSKIPVYLLLIINGIMLTGNAVIENICRYNNIKIRRKETVGCYKVTIAKVVPGEVINHSHCLLMLRLN